MTAERERWPLWIPVFLAFGIALYFALSQEPPRWLGAGAALICLLAGAMAVRRGDWRITVLAMLLLYSTAWAISSRGM